MTGARRAGALPLAAVLLLAALVHAPALTGPFQFDDLATIAVDPGARSLAAWWADAARHVRPLTKASFALTHALGEAIGDVPTGHHIGNVALHVAVVAAFYALGRRLCLRWLPAGGPCGAHAAALWAAAAFAVHPLGTEAVDYLSGRSMALGALGATLSLLAYLRWRARGGASRLAAAVAAAAAAALARETALVAPLLWLAWEAVDRATAGIGGGAPPAARDAPPHVAETRGGRAPGDRPRGRSHDCVVGTVVATALIAGGLAWLATHARYPALLELSARIAHGRLGEPTLAAALQHFVDGLALLRYPSIDPGTDPARLGTAARATVFALTAAAAGLAWRARRTRPWLLFALAWALAWIVPLYLVRVRHDAIAERHFYPAIWAAAFAIAMAAVAWAARTRASPDGRGDRPAAARARALSAAGALALAALAVVTAVRSADYRSEVALWEAARRSAPANVRVLNNLGVAYMIAGRWEDAEAVLTIAESLDPLDERVIDNLLAAQRRDLGASGPDSPASR